MATPEGRQPGRDVRRAGAAALLAMTFLAGGVGGFALGAWRTREATGAARPTGDPVTRPPSDPVVRIHDELPASFDALALSAEQRATITDILARARPKTDAALRDLIPRLRAITDSVDAQIRAVLRPAQREQLSRIRGAHAPVLLLKRPTPGGGPPRVDTVMSGSRRSP